MSKFRSNAYRIELNNVHATQRGVLTEIHIRDALPAGTGVTGGLLAQLTGNGTAWAGVSNNGVLTSNPITGDISAPGSGVALSYVVRTQAGLWLESGNLVDDGVTITNTNIAAGQTVDMAADWIITEPYDDGV